MFKNVLLIIAFKNYFWRKEILNFYMENYSHFMFCVHIFYLKDTFIHLSNSEQFVFRSRLMQVYYVQNNHSPTIDNIVT